MSKQSKGLSYEAEARSVMPSLLPKLTFLFPLILATLELNCSVKL